MYKYFGKSKRPYELKRCENCWNEEWILKEGHYCSTQCMGEMRTGTDNPNYKPLRFKGRFDRFRVAVL